MNQIGKDSAGLFGKPIGAATGPDGLVNRVMQRLADHRAALIQGFPTTDAEQYIGFLRYFGRPLENYGAGSTSTAYTLHPNINVVRCSTTGTRVQEQGGPLPAHSARAFSKSRPKYIAMLMTTDGWPAEPGEAGESTIIRWSDALRQMRQSTPDTYSADHALLTRAPLRITAQHVVDEWSTLPLLYDLDDATCDEDLGARYSLAILDQLPRMAMDDEVRTQYAEALGHFAQAANHPAVRYTHTLRPGEMIILDNDRFGHGRLSFPHTRTEDGQLTVNPRTLWSCVLG
ncbi:TauD/TfdA family dioxygenase [Streptomyces sp. NPDC048637]|uniref:TauD/TfdA family dioxygenase n=1 Tax=Streptomyces sp. NPDC048637 TaxID=3155636 RepID=UPI00344437C6